MFVVLVAVVVVVGMVVLLLILVWMPAHAPEVHSATDTSPYCSLGCDTRAGIQVLVGQRIRHMSECRSSPFFI